MADTISGVLKRIGKDQYAIRLAERSFRRGPVEVTVPPSMNRQYGLMEGAGVTAVVDNSKNKPRVVTIESLGGLPPQDFRRRPKFSDLVALDPFERFDLGCSGNESMRIVDLIAPIGRGTRQLIVSPPKAGKTVLLEQMVQSIRRCSPKSRIIVMLVDERPEEVTHFKRSTEGAQIVSSTSDNDADEHCELCELVLAHVQMELECGRDIVLMIDSLTRMGRAFNNRTRHRGEPRGHTMTGGLEAGVMEIPRRVFGLARKIENGGSVTVIATCLVDTGSRMDQLIFEEFKGTGNSEVVLDRPLAEARVWPAINIPASGTRKEAKLYPQGLIRGITMLRRVLTNYKPRDSVEALLKLLRRYPTNGEFLQSMAEKGDDLL
jgi:transcription termination factor Rho